MQYRAIFHAGASLESAADVARDGKQAKEATELLVQAAGLFRRDGKPEAASAALEKAGQ